MGAKSLVGMMGGTIGTKQVPIDYINEAIYGSVSEVFQGKPCLQGVLENTVKLSTGRNDLSVEGCDAWCAILDASYSRDREVIVFKLMAVVNQINGAVLLSVDIRRRGVQIAQTTKLCQSNVSMIQCESSYLPDFSKGESYEVICQLHIIPPPFQYLYGSIFYIVGTVSDASAQCVSSVTIQNPRKKSTPQGTPIIVGYNRTSQAGGIVDYDYYEYRASSGDQMVYLEVDGKAVLNSGYEYDRLDLDNTGLLMYRENEPMPYKNEITQNIVSYDAGTRTMTWSFPKEWKTPIKNSVSAGNKECLFLLTLGFRCKNRTDAYHITVSSVPYSGTRPSYYAEIPTIKIFWGCFGPDTLITMADQSRRPISLLRIGDMILNGQGEPVHVEDIIMGQEEKLYNITVSSGHSIKLTETHPLMTQNGMKQVIDLTQDDELLMESGSFESIIEAYPIEHQDRVYNINTSDGETVFADSFVAGNFNAQTKYQRELRAENDVRLPGELLKELNMFL